MKTLLLIPSRAKSGLEAEIAADRHPTMDYHALAGALSSIPGDEVELLDHAAVESDSHPLVQLLRKVAGLNAALALMGFLRRDEHDAIFTNAESVAVPLALLLKTVAKRPRHVTIAHRLSPKKKQVLYRWFKLHRQMDTVFVYSSAQRDVARSALGIPDRVLRLIPFHADHRFYRPFFEAPVREEQICAAGLEWRDYPTLIEAVTDQPNLSVRLAAASPWSAHTNETESRALPAHVDARRYDYHGLRKLYAESSVVVVPLYQNDFQAGITTMLEGMAMGKPVVVTGTIGQTDVIIHEQNGLYVAPGGVDGWRKAIERLRGDHALRARLGRNARRWVEENATLDHWVEELMAAVHNTNRSTVREKAAAWASVSARDPFLRSRESGVQLRTVSTDEQVRAAEA